MLKLNQLGVGLLEMIIVLGVLGSIITTIATLYTKDLTRKQKQHEINNIYRTVDQIIKFSTRVNHLPRDQITTANTYILSEIAESGAAGLPTGAVIAPGIATVHRVEFDSFDKYSWMLSKNCTGGKLANMAQPTWVAEDILKCDFLNAFSKNYTLDYVEYHFTSPWVNYAAVQRQVDEIRIHISGKSKSDHPDLLDLEAKLKQALQEHRINNYGVDVWLTKETDIPGVGVFWEQVTDGSGDLIRLSDTFSYSGINSNQNFGALFVIKPEQYPALLRDGSSKLDAGSALCWEGGVGACIQRTLNGVEFTGNILVNEDINVDGDINAEGDIVSQSDIIAEGNIIARSGIINTTEYSDGTIMRMTTPISKRYTYETNDNLIIAKPKCPSYQGNPLQPRISLSISGFVGIDNVDLRDDFEPVFPKDCDLATGENCLGFVSSVLNGYRNTASNPDKYWDVTSVIGGNIAGTTEGVTNSPAVTINVTTWCQL